MFKTYFKQALQMLRQNPFISVISTVGTALAIMMILIMIVSENIKNIEIAPEVNRGRSYYIGAYEEHDTVRDSRYRMGLHLEPIRDYLYTLKIPETVTVFEYNYVVGYRQAVINRQGENDFSKIDLRYIDDAFWRAFDFDFVEGAPFTREEFESGLRRAVLSRTQARTLFKENSAVGQTVQLNGVPHTVSGVVEDVSPVFKMAYGDVWAPYTSKLNYDRRGRGEAAIPYLVMLVAKDPKDYPRIIDEVGELSRKWTVTNGTQNVFTFSVPTPHDMPEMITGGIFSIDEIRQTKVALTTTTLSIFLLLLLIPAMNLSGFAVSRMKKRIEEIGVRKAFGARTGTVLVQVLYENAITSLVGGVLGLILSYIAIFLVKSWILGVDAGSSIPLRALVSPGIFAAVVVLCVLLSLISSGIPALRAARRRIVNSLSKNDR